MPLRPQPTGGIERSGFPFVCPSEDQVKILAKIESQDLLMVET